MEQFYVCFGSSDDRNLVACKSAEILDLVTLGSFCAFGPLTCRRPKHDNVLAQDGNRLCVSSHIEVAAGNREIDFGLTQHRDAFGSAISDHWRKPNMAALSREGLRHGLNNLDIVTSWRANRNAQCLRTQNQIQAGRGRRKTKQAADQNKDQEFGIGAPAGGGASAFEPVVGLSHMIPNQLPQNERP